MKIKTPKLEGTSASWSDSWRWHTSWENSYGWSRSWSESFILCYLI
jgi:hypothetical protein